MPRLVTADPSGLPDLVRADQARAVGLTAGQIRHRVRSGRWSAPVRGVYDPVPTDHDSPPQAADDEHARQARAHALAHARSTIALGSAAVLHGLPLVSGIPRDVHLISEVGRAETRAGVTIHRLPLGDNDVVNLGAPVTSAVRTWADITRVAALADSLSLGDAGIRQGQLTATMLVEVAAIATGRGCRRMRAAAALVDGRRESALESWSAACFHRWGLPMPDHQAVIRDHRGDQVARVDFLWDDVAVIGEADGAGKYDMANSLYEEKRREDRLRSMGFRVIRWGWSDLARPNALHDELWGAVRRSSRPVQPVPEYVRRRRRSSRFAEFDS
ncbi:MAG: hypothetical protein KGP12_12355 [Actinomycetales bacterium]|nr:hypothetical protein [Actinomycetales bacterium]